MSLNNIGVKFGVEDLTLIFYDFYLIHFGHYALWLKHFFFGEYESITGLEGVQEKNV